MAVKAKATISLVRVDDGETGKGVSKTEVYYYLSTSNTTQTGGSWVTTPPAWIDGRYYWQKIKTTFTDSTTSESKPVCITGGKGSSGSDGKSVSSITTQFYLSTSKTTQTGGSWVDTMPTWSVGKYLWTRSKIVYINPSSTVYTAPVCDSSWDAINDIEIGGRNFIQNSDQFLEEESDGTGPINASQTDMPVSALNFYNTKGTQCTISVDVTLENAVSTVTNSGHRVGTEITLKRGDGSINQYVGAWITLREAPISTSQRLSITYDLYDDYLESYKPVCGIYIQGLTGGKVRVGKPKLEIGNKATDWTPAPEDTQSAIDDALDQATSEITTQYTSLINETAKQLELMVTQLKTITDGHTTSISSISNQLQITSEMAQFVKTTTEKLQDAVDGKLSATEVQEWARFDGANLELGASNSPFKCKLSTTELAFYQGANKVAWISNNELNILTAIIAKSIGCGNFTFVDEGELGFSLI